MHIGPVVIKDRFVHFDAEIRDLVAVGRFEAALEVVGSVVGRRLFLDDLLQLRINFMVRAADHT